ncbi:N-acetylmuramoyl-L-alanine amidase [Paucisalibacillus globulus]|uniref:N-acetylmuramoyl-L-alanine amidase n=1 Tax=Paucisalibacillus globulus TaxID=351095 RepID=UPI0004036375|nr:N-acetylmuramoyl-L-alanine amidase [Paucisalibacillus globulus]
MKKVWKVIMIVTLVFLVACNTAKAIEEEPEAEPKEENAISNQVSSTEEKEVEAKQTTASEDKKEDSKQTAAPEEKKAEAKQTASPEEKKAETKQTASSEVTKAEIKQTASNEKKKVETKQAASTEKKNAETKQAASNEKKNAKTRQASSLKSMNKMYLPDQVSENRTTPITHAVIHFSSNVLAKPENPFQVRDIYNIFKDYGVSAHYVIDRSGQVYQFVSEDRVAYHAGKGSLSNYPTYNNKLNAYSIGIELLAIGTKQEMASMMSEEHYDTIDPLHIGYTAEQYETLKELLVDISTFYGTIPLDRDHIIGHDEYAPDRKTDPGSLFDWNHLMDLVNE